MNRLLTGSNQQFNRNKKAQSRFGNLFSKKIELAKNWLMWNKKFVYVLNYLKVFKAVHKNNPRTHLLQ